MEGVNAHHVVRPTLRTVNCSAEGDAEGKLGAGELKAAPLVGEVRRLYRDQALTIARVGTTPDELPKRSTDMIVPLQMPEGRNKASL
jgi:hypothetical protein